MKRIIQNLIILLCFCAFCFFSYKIYNYNKEEKAQEDLNTNIINDVVIEKNIEDIESDNEMSPIKIDFEKLKKENEDIKAWIYCEGTPMNYPIVQATDNDYYLRRLVDGSYNQAGTIFMDYKNNEYFEDYNTIVYGHNMKNETMFGTLINYKKQKYFDEHPEIFLFTENKEYKIQLFAGFTTSSESDLYKFPKNKNTNEKLIKMALKNSTFKSEVNVEPEDKIITLSTCSYDFENARYVLLGVLREIK